MEADKMRSQKFQFGFFVVAALIVHPSISRASTYSYIGTPLTTFVANGVPLSNAALAFAGKSIFGEFTVAAPLGADFSGFVTPTQFSFSGALIPLSSPTSYSFDIQTSDTGAIIDWMISITERVGSASIGISTSNKGDSSFSLGPTTYIEGANSIVGAWSGPVAVTPIPGTLLLFASGLAGAGLVYRLKKRKQKVGQLLA